MDFAWVFIASRGIGYVSYLKGLRKPTPRLRLPRQRSSMKVVSRLVYFFRFSISICVLEISFAEEILTPGNDSEANDEFSIRCESWGPVLDIPHFTPHY